MKDYDKRISSLKTRIETLENDIHLLREKKRTLEKKKQEGNERIEVTPLMLPSGPVFLKEKDYLRGWSREEKEYVEGLVRKYWQEFSKVHGFDMLPLLEIQFGYASNTWGTCRGVHNKQGVIIRISRYNLLEGEAFLKNTILHELCHSIKECWGRKHGPVWKKYAEKVSSLYGTPIKRSSNGTKYHPPLRK